MIWFYSTFRRLMIPIISKLRVSISGRELRKIFNTESGRKIGIAGFYFWMSKMEEEKLVVSFDSEEIVDGQILKLRQYRKP